MTGPETAGEVKPAPAGKRPWQRPSITRVGLVGEQVQGGGKSGPNDDSDPQSTRKTGTG